MQLKKKELLELFNSAIDNAKYLYDAAKTTARQIEGKKYPSLGLAELALEELGKSYSCLAVYSKAANITDWHIFWKEWKQHELKAHRAFFFEFFYPLRIEMESSDETLNFPSNRQSFSSEKEVAFYVDIHKGNRKIHKPENEITDVECWRRITSLLGLFSTAYYVKDMMNADEPESFKDAVSDYAYLTLNTEMFQQDVVNILEKMKKTGDNNYNRALFAIAELFVNTAGLEQ